MGSSSLTLLTLSIHSCISVSLDKDSRSVLFSSSNHFSVSVCHMTVGPVPHVFERPPGNNKNPTITPHIPAFKEVLMMP